MTTFEIIHLSDILYSQQVPGNLQRLKTCLAYIKANLTCDALIVTGNLIQLQAEEWEEFHLIQTEWGANPNDTAAYRAYEDLRNIFDQMPMPYFVVPGNLDVRDTLKKSFVFQRPWEQDQVLMHYPVFKNNFPVALIGLDTAVTGKEYGTVEMAQLSWLTTTLSLTQKPVIFFMHHPPLGPVPLTSTHVPLPPEIEPLFNEIFWNFEDFQTVPSSACHLICAGHAGVAGKLSSPPYPVVLAPRIGAGEAPLPNMPSGTGLYGSSNPGFVRHSYDLSANVTTSTVYFVSEDGTAQTISLS